MGKKTEKKPENGVPVTENGAQAQYGNESFGIPSDCTKKQKFNKVKLCVYIVLVAIICGTLYSGFQKMTHRYLPEMTYDKSTSPLLYIKGDSVTVKEPIEKKGKTVVTSEACYGEGDGSYVAITDDGKTVFYIVESEDTRVGTELYRQELSAIETDGEVLSKPLLIDGGVTDYVVHPDGDFVLYRKNETLYFSDMKQSVYVASGVKEYYLSENNQQVLLYKDGELWTCAAALKAEPELVDVGITKVLNPKNEYAKIYYLKGSQLYVKELDKPQVLLAEDVLDAILLDGKYLYFTRTELYEWPFEDIFLDDRLSYDAELLEPESENFEVVGADGVPFVDETEYQAAVARYQAKEQRDAIRDYLELQPVATEEYALYTLRRNEEKLVDIGLCAPELRYNSCKKTICYAKPVLPEEKIRLSTLSDIEGMLDKAEAFVRPEEICQYVLSGNAKPFFGMEGANEGQMEISLDGKYLYRMEHLGTDGIGSLVRYSIRSQSLEDRTVLCEGVQKFALDGADSLAVIVQEAGRLWLCVDTNLTHLSDNAGPDFFYVDGSLYYYDAYNQGAQVGNLMRYRDGKTKMIDTNVRSFNVRNLETVVYVKNYNPETGTGDLYQKKGGKAKEKLDSNVRIVLK